MAFGSSFVTPFLLLAVYLVVQVKSNNQPGQYNSLYKSLDIPLVSRAAVGSSISPNNTSRNANCPPAESYSFWLEGLKHQGIAPFNNNASYQVFRNVKDFGAKGDGIADDTAAINNAISSGNRCVPGACASSTTTPALVYFPSGIYIVTAPIVDYYYTQLIGNPNCPPVLKALSSFTGPWVIDGDPYVGGSLGYGSTNVFWRQIRNFIVDLTSVAPTNPLVGIHWPTGQSTSLQNIVFKLSDAPGTQQEGIFIESGSGGFMTDLVFYGGLHGVRLGNQQFTLRNLVFHNAVTAIYQLWDWGWTYQGISIINCSIGLDMSALTNGVQDVGSITIFDSIFKDTPVGIITARSSTSLPLSGGSLILENVKLDNVKTAILGTGNTTLLAGTSGKETVQAWGQGHSFTPSDSATFQGPIAPNQRASSLTSGDKYYTRSKPQYDTIRASQFVSVRSAGAVGNGKADDTAALQGVITSAATSGKIVFIDAGYYKITKTITIPPGSRIVGESYPVIMSSGKFFADVHNPQPVVRVGESGEEGSIEWSDTIVSTQGSQSGAILIQYNLASGPSSPAGLWDVHTRIGGFSGSQLQVSECPKTPNVPTTAENINMTCIAAFASMHITSSATGLYLENVWLWVADHDVESPDLTQITIYAGRGMLIDSSTGVLWLYGTAVEHHVLYQYQLSHTQNIFLGQIQTESPYFQPNPPANIPFPTVPALNDPELNNTPQSSWGLRILSSSRISIYGAGLYSFFSNYNVHCSDPGNGETCQPCILSVEGNSFELSVYNLNTVGTTDMITLNGQDVANAAVNSNGFIDTIALFRV